MDNDILLKQFSETQEGYRLALGSVAEVLNKMDQRLEKQEADEQAKKLAEMEALESRKIETEKANLVKEITSAVIKQLIDLQGDKPVTAEKKWPLSTVDTDNAVNAKLRTATTEVQRPIQAMKKQIDKDHEEEMEDNGATEFPKEDEEGVENGMVKDHSPALDEKTTEEYPMGEDEYKEHPVMKLILAKLQNIESKMAGMEKQSINISKSVDVAAKKKFDEQMRKTGFHKEIPSNPSLMPEKSLGANETTIPIVKSASKEGVDDVTEQLSKMSWRDIWDLRIKKSMGETDGIPKELMG